MSLRHGAIATLRSLGRVQEPAKERDLAAGLLIFAVALLLRLCVVYYFISEPVWDGHYYHFGAARIAHGFGYSEDAFRAGQFVWKPWAHYPVGYSFFLSLFYRVFGTHVWVAAVANAFVGAATVLGLHAIALPFLGKWRARLAAVLAALHPGLLLYTVVLMSEPLAAALTVFAVWASLATKRRLFSLAASGLLLGLSVLVRPSALLVLPLMAVAIPGDFKRRVLSTAVVSVFCMAAVLPWTARNCKRMDGCALVSTNAGWNLAIGALTDTGRFRPLRATDGCPVVTGQVQQDRCFWDLGVKVILEHPHRWLKLVPAKLAQTFDHESFAIEYLREGSPMAWPESRRVAYREKLTLYHRGLLLASALSVIGLSFSRRALRSPGTYVQAGLLIATVLLGRYLFSEEPHPFYWLAILIPFVSVLPLPGRPAVSGAIGFSVGFLGLTALTHALFFGDDRYHLVVTPFLCLLTAAALRPASVSRGGASTENKNRLVPESGSGLPT